MLFFIILFPVLNYCLTPVIVIPGFGGSCLNTVLHDCKPPSIFCKKNSDEYQIWINILQDIRFLDIDCFEFIMELNWENNTQRSYSHEGVTILPKDFGGISGCDCLVKDLCEFSHYFYGLFEALGDAGYVAGKNMLAATYDWRLSPQQLINVENYFENLQNLVEETYEKNDNTPIALVCHSMGCSLSGVFLGSYVSEDWKGKYIDKWIPLSGVFDGAVETFGYLVVGITPVLPTWLDWEIFGRTLQKYVSELARKTSNWPALQWMIPELTINNTDIIMETDERNYTYDEYNEMLDDAGLGQVYDIFQAVKVLPKMFSGHYDSLDIYCVYAINTSTPIRFYVDDIQSPTIGKITESVNGDGIVTLPALEICDGLNENVEVYTLTNSEHQALVSDQRTIDYIVKLVT